MKAWLASDLSELDLLVIQIDGLHVGDHVLMAAIGVDGNGDKHVLAVVEGATENTVVVQALIDNLLARGLDPTLPRLFIVDGAKALSKAIRNTFGVAAAIQRCQVHKGRNIIERLPQHLHASAQEGSLACQICHWGRPPSAQCRRLSAFGESTRTDETNKARTAICHQAERLSKFIQRRKRSLAPTDAAQT